MYRFLSPGLIVLVPQDLNLTFYAQVCTLRCVGSEIVIKSPFISMGKPINFDRFNYLLDRYMYVTG